MEGKQQRRRPPRASVPAFGGWEGGGAAPPDYSLDFTKIRAARMQRRTKALSWSSFVGNAAAAAEAPGGGDEERHHQWSSAASEGDDDHRERRRRHRRLRSDAADQTDDRQPIRPGRVPAPKTIQISAEMRAERSQFHSLGGGKFKGYLFGCVGGLWISGLGSRTREGLERIRQGHPREGKQAPKGVPARNKLEPRDRHAKSRFVRVILAQGPCFVPILSVVSEVFVGRISTFGPA
ncbi:uncharacterized protein C2845_PM18G10780 [Panicum miliaceum]|uniref:RIN4 pathogenic type III effector avirulence factor Avr cleavage site domain-containing protein n=1 Tax=Panicum miliaceum TaxID=4540 RepID=A0A3L6PHP9_PANMI|nr:uncharacterized protein C2845_PM18G10780 [Panicum miliaceum]